MCDQRLTAGGCALEAGWLGAGAVGEGVGWGVGVLTLLVDALGKSGN